ncbi:MAG: ATP-binding protein [Synechococcaceae cyanobacterium]
MTPAPAPPLSAAPLPLWLAVAAGRLLLRLPEHQGLRPLVQPLPDLTLPADGAIDPLALAEAVAAGSDDLLDGLAADPGASPLGRIRAAAALSRFDLELLALAVLPCLEEAAAVAVGQLTGGERRLRLGQALRLLGAAGDPAAVRQAVRESPLWRLGMLREGEEPGALESRLQPTAALLAGVDGAVATRLGEGWRRRPLPAAAAGEPSPQRQAQARRLLALARQGPLHLVGQAGAVEQVLALAAAPGAALLLEAPPGEAAARPPWAEAWLAAVASGRLLALRSDATTLEAPPPGVPPTLLVAPESAHLRGGTAVLARLELGGNDPLELAAAWQQALALNEAEADQLAGRTWLAPSQVPALAAGVTGETGAQRLAAALERLAVRVPPRAAGLAHRRQPQVAWQQLVLAADTGEALEELVRRVEQRVRVQRRWGLGEGARGNGVIGLLHGPSGTGKTLAADAIATRLRLPLLAVDLSLVVSKYIGETEKNLAQVFDAAEGFAALLFFDEADALFGKRTGVQDAHDRYANIEVNYLLQRLEAFEGLALLSTNLLQGLDEAFLRRFDQMVAFRRPGSAERRLIWQGHLPRDQLGGDVDVGELARLFDLSGGDIRNAALSAAYAAAAASEPINRDRLWQAIRRETAKSGAPMPNPELFLSLTPSPP